MMLPRLARQLHANAAVLAFVLFAFVISYACFGYAPAAHAAAGACTAPATDYGTVTATVTIPADGTYYIWSRMAADSSADSSYLLQVDTSNCFTVGTSGTKSVPVYSAGATTYFANNSTNWLDTTTAGAAVSVSMTAGSHTITMIGNAPNLVLDRLIFTQDSSCTPSGTGDNCADSTAPSVSMSAPASGTTISGTSVTVSATATDDTGVQRVDFYTDSATSPFASDTTASGSTYSVTLDSTGLSNGTHTITAKAYDVASNVQTASVSVTVNNSGGSGDTTPPTISITSPSASSILSKDLNNAHFNSTAYSVTVNASDASGIKQVAFKLDGSTVSTKTTSPFTYTLNLTSLSCGTHTLQAQATDNSTNQNVASSSTVSFTTTYAADIDGNCSVDITDLSRLATKYNQSSGIGRADINQDGTVNITDVSLLAASYGTH